MRPSYYERREQVSACAFRALPDGQHARTPPRLLHFARNQDVSFLEIECASAQPNVSPGTCAYFFSALSMKGPLWMRRITVATSSSKLTAWSLPNRTEEPVPWPGCTVIIWAMLTSTSRDGGPGRLSTMNFVIGACHPRE